MTELSELRSSLVSLHSHIAGLLAADSTILKEREVTPGWNVLDTVGHINAWGLIFLDEARYMAEHPGKPFPYQIHTTTNYDDENERLVARRRGWTVEQHAGENRRLLEEIPAFVDSFGGEWPDYRVPLPWDEKPTNIAGLLGIHRRHGYEHLREILNALGETSSG